MIRSVQPVDRLIAVLFAGVFIVATAITSFAEPATQEELINAINSLQPKLNANLTEMDLRYWPDLLRHFPDFNRLTSQANRFKQPAITFLSKMGSTESKMAPRMPLLDKTSLLIAAMYGLEPNGYLDFVDNVLALSEQGTITLRDSDLGSLIYPHGRLEDLLVYNYKAPRVRALLERVRRCWQSQAQLSISTSALNSTFLQGIDEILSGALCKDRERRRQESPHEYPNNIVPIKLSENRAETINIPGSFAKAQDKSLTMPEPKQRPVTQPALTAMFEGLRLWPWIAGATALAALALFAWKRRS